MFFKLVATLAICSFAVAILMSVVRAALEFLCEESPYKHSMPDWVYDALDWLDCVVPFAWMIAVVLVVGVVASGLIASLWAVEVTP